MGEKLAGENGRGILSGLLRETLGEREDVALGKIEFHALDAVHGKEDDAGSKGFAVLDLRGQVVEAGDVDAAQAEAFGSEIENGAPKLFARVSERRDDERAGTKRGNGLRILIKAGAGHGLIVVWDVGKMQTDLAFAFALRGFQVNPNLLSFLIKMRALESQRACGV